jgi:RHH-type proline utilization regulon transcriptional repressor/proline dehydrogenase/delta 1-pyrroline-5-carboxylate dehydrogenase
MVRLVKGAYWDAEVKRAQVEGLSDFPVFTDKHATDVSYLAGARKLLGMTDRIYPQFATHNAHTVAAVLRMAEDMGVTKERFEFQRLHGMGEALHEIVRAEEGTGLRIYAPVGAHRDLLAYLVRRLLENGANSSFVNRIVDESIPPEEVVRDPFDPIPPATHPHRRRALPARAPNSRGRDLSDRPPSPSSTPPAPLPRDHLGGRTRSSPRARRPAPRARSASPPRAAPSARDRGRRRDRRAGHRSRPPLGRPLPERIAVLRRAADLYEAHEGEALALLAREAGKTLADGVGELREAVDFLRYYASEAERTQPEAGQGLWACISPWNFPLAIFTGQIAAALVMGNAVLAKPAPQTPLIAQRAVQWLLDAGVPVTALQFLPGGAETGAALTSDPRLSGVAFTGSTATAQRIRRAMAAGPPGRPLIAETGGINAMVVDSTALPEQAVRDILTSAFRSAGQRCSALRCLYLQEEVAEPVCTCCAAPWPSFARRPLGPRHRPRAPSSTPRRRRASRAHIDAPARETACSPSAPSRATAPMSPRPSSASGIEAISREIFGPCPPRGDLQAADLDRCWTP